MSGVGGDISGTHAIVIELSRGGFQYHLGRVAILPGFEYAPDAPPATGAAVFGGAVATLPGTLRRRGTVCSLSGRDVMFRMVQAGTEDPSAQRAVVRLEVEEMTGGGTPMLSSWQRVHSPGGNAMLMVGVAREALVEHYAATLRAAGLSVSAFVPAPVALYQCHLMSGAFDDNGVRMVANIGETGTDVILIQGSELLLARGVPTGVADFVNRMALELGMNREQARETLFSRVNIKPGIAHQNVSGERAVGAAQDAAAQLFMQLSGLVALARGQLSAPGLSLGAITICGAGASIQGMRDFLRHRFRLDVDVMNPLSGFDTGALDDESLATVNQYASALAVPLGLAKIAADRASGGLSFAPPSLLARRDFLRKNLWLYAGVLVLLLSLAYALTFSSQVRIGAVEVKRQAHGEASAYHASHVEIAGMVAPPGSGIRERMAALSPLNRGLLDTEQRVIELAEVRRPGLDALRLLDVLTRECPREATLIRFALDTETRPDGPPFSVLRLDMFIESAARPADAIYEDVKRALKAAPGVANILPVRLEDAGDGSGMLARGLRVEFQNSAVLLRPDASPPARKTGGAK